MRDGAVNARFEGVDMNLTSEEQSVQTYGVTQSESMWMESPKSWVVFY
jgi:hypothetical protein